MVHPAALAASFGPVIRIARKSLTLVRVGPVMIWSPTVSKKPCPSLLASHSLVFTPIAAAPTIAANAHCRFAAGDQHAGRPRGLPVPRCLAGDSGHDLADVARLTL